jgi:glycosyltransferase 2 family protein
MTNAQAVRRPMRARKTLLIAIALIAALAVPLLLGGRAALSAVAHFPLSGLALLALFTLIGAFAKAAKMQGVAYRLGVRLPWLRMSAISLAGDAAFLATPMGAGGYPLSLFLLNRNAVGLGDATAIIAIDQLFDLLFFLIVLPFFTASLLSLRTLVWVSAALLTIGLSLWLLRDHLAPLLRSALRWSRWRRPMRHALRMINVMLKKLRLLRHAGPRLILQTASLTVLQQLSRYGLLWYVLTRFDIDLPFGEVFAAQALLVSAAGWTGVPAGAGAAELGLTAAFASRVPTSTMASALLLWRLASLHLPLVLGGLSLLFLLRTRQQVASAVSATVDEAAAQTDDSLIKSEPHSS